MKYFSVFIIILLCLSACKSDQVQNNHTVIYSDYSQFPNSPTVEIIINGQGPYTFLIDTGIFASAVSEKVFSELNLPRPESRTIQAHHVNKTYERRVTPSLTLTIPETQIVRTTRLIILDHEHLGNSLDGVIGLAELRGAYLRNLPSEQQLEITLNTHPYECDLFKKSSGCHPEALYRPQIPTALGGREMILLLDTGYHRERSMILFKSDLNNDIWEKYGHFSASGSIQNISDKPVKTLKTHDFTFNGKDTCYADFIIRNPHDSSTYFNTPAAILGWNALKKVAFEIDLKERKTTYPPSRCPYEKMNRLGIWRFDITEDHEQAIISYVEIGSPADRAGLEDGDVLQRIYLEDGTIVEKFDHSFFNARDQHVYSEDGTRLIFDVMRDGQPFQTEAITHKPIFIPMNLNE